MRLAASCPAIRPSFGAHARPWRTLMVVGLTVGILGCASTRTPMPSRLDGSAPDQRQFAADRQTCMEAAGLPETRQPVTTYEGAALWHRREAEAALCMHQRGWTLRR